MNGYVCRKVLPFCIVYFVFCMYCAENEDINFTCIVYKEAHIG